MEGRRDILIRDLFFKQSANKNFQSWLQSAKYLSFRFNLFILPECNFMSNCGNSELEKLTLQDNILFFETSECKRAIFSVAKVNLEYSILFSYTTLNLMSSNMEFTFLKGRSIVKLLLQYKEIYERIMKRYDYSLQCKSILFDDFISFILLPIFTYEQLIYYLSCRNHKVWIIHKIANNWVWKPICSDQKKGISIGLAWKECQKTSVLCLE